MGASQQQVSLRPHRSPTLLSALQFQSHPVNPGLGLVAYLARRALPCGLLEVTEPEVVSWDGLPEAHQAMWENRHTGSTYVVNHALPELGLRSRDALLEAWAARGGGEPLG